MPGQPSPFPDRVDAVVVGAGTAGAAAAAALAAHGLRVACVDRAPLDRAGASWVNGVTTGAFAAAGLPVPTGAERRSEALRFHLFAGTGPHRVIVDDHDALEVDMRLLVARLHERAREHGAVLAGDVAVLGWDGRALSTTRGPIRADIAIDAAGLAGPRLLGQPRVGPHHICSAAQQVRAVTDLAAARGFFADRGVPPGEVLCFTGVAGGFSILNVRLAGDEVGILTGSVTAGGQPSGRAMIESFVASQPWIGDVVFGGSRAIPLRRPFDRLVHNRAAAVGDAGCQVFPAHGSGIGAGLVAARVLADAVAGSASGRRGSHATDAASGLARYAVVWQRTHGGLLAAYDLFRRYSQRLAPDDLVTFFRAGLIDPDTARACIDQTLPAVTPGMVARKLAAAARAPTLAGRLAGVLARMAAARLLYRRYPAHPEDDAALSRWSGRIARVFGDSPDVEARSA